MEFDPPFNTEKVGRMRTMAGRFVNAAWYDASAAFLIVSTQDVYTLLKLPVSILTVVAPRFPGISCVNANDIVDVPMLTPAEEAGLHCLRATRLNDSSVLAMGRIA